MMKRALLSLTLVVFSIATSVYLSSCKDDEDPAPRPKISFASSNQVVNENQGTINVAIELDNPAPEDLVVEYSIGGTATRKTSTNAATADYEITGFLGEVEIAKGETSGAVVIGILNDGIFEDDETIILSIEDVDSEQVDFGSRLETTITIVSDDAAIVASFAATTLTVNESDAGFHEIVVQLDKPAASNITLNYQLSNWLNNNNLVAGVAIDSLRASEIDFPSEYWDYYIDGTAGQLTIESGQSSGIIRINVLSDFQLEDDETITLTLSASPGVTIGTNNQMVVTIEQEDGRVVILDWEATNVDMDLFLWFKVQTDYLLLATSIIPSLTAPEGNIIPDAFLESLADEGFTTIDFGMSYVYYEGPAGDVPFQSIIADFAAGAFEPLADREIKEATYTAANKNPWDTETGTDPQIVQTFTYAGGAYGAASDITVPASGSRMGTVTIPKNVTKKAPAFIHNLRKIF